MGTTEEALANAEKLGYHTGLFVEHPFTKKEIPIYFANLFMDYGTGAIFGCPAHDQGILTLLKNINSIFCKWFLLQIKLPLLKLIQAKINYKL